MYSRYFAVTKSLCSESHMYVYCKCVVNILDEKYFLLDLVYNYIYNREAKK